jgi:hypothetical protein
MRDIWVGQYFNSDVGHWQDVTNEYDNALQAELMLYRWYLDSTDDEPLLAPTLEL